MNEIYGSSLIKVSKYKIEMNNYLHVLKITDLEEIL